MSTPFATVSDMQALYGTTYDADTTARINELLSDVSDLIRYEGQKVKKDIDALVAVDAAYRTVVKVVTCDVVNRVLRQSTIGEPMSQESQAALGYSWSGTYAVPGGGVAMSLMNNERKILGLKQQGYGVVELWERYPELQ